MSWAGNGGGGGRGGAYPRGQQPQQVVLPNAGDLGQLVVRGITTFARRNKILSGSYVLGILVLLLVGSGTKLTLDQARRYNKIMNTIDVEAEFQASQQYWAAQQAYLATKGWFTCDGTCQRNKARMDEKKRMLDEIRAEGYARMSDAKSVAGLWSEVGVGEVKDSFWKYFASGHQFAKRQSMWDAMFIGIRSMSRDETMWEYALRVLIQVLINFTLGLFMALGLFIVGLWSIIRSYQPHPLVAVLFFLCAACAAFSFVATYVLLIYGAAAGGVYSVVKLGETSARARLQQQQRQQYMNHRPHYE